MTIPVLLLQLSACAVGPDYVRPPVETPAEFKEAKGWKTAQPRDHELRGKWWEVFDDPVLASLEEQVSISNQNLAQAEANVRQAQALVQAARANYFPRATGAVSATRSGSGAAGAPPPSTSRSLNVDANWEADLWGRVRRTVESQGAVAQASAADLEAARLSAQVQVAQNYFQLRASDAQRQLFERTIADYQRSLQLTQNQYAVGIVARENVVLAQTQLQMTQAQTIELGVQRAQLEHAIALLIGIPASSFSLAPDTLATAVPIVPAGVPSALLERRPDIAAAERRVAAANAQIGVAAAAWFPSLTVSAGLGFQSSDMAPWLSAANRVWSIGPLLALTLFDAGARRAQSAQAIAAYDADVAAYRQVVLTGFLEVEDSLATLRILEQEAKIQDATLQSARLSVTLTNNQYKAGIVSYLNVITVQTTALNNERTAVDLQGRRLVACAQLIRALGGGW